MLLLLHCDFDMHSFVRESSVLIIPKEKNCTTSNVLRVRRAENNVEVTMKLKWTVLIIYRLLQYLL